MAKGFSFDAIIKVCLANKNTSQNIEDFKNSFDVVILGDPGMGYVNSLLGEIIE